MDLLSRMYDSLILLIVVLAEVLLIGLGPFLALSQDEMALAMASDVQPTQTPQQKWTITGVLQHDSGVTVVAANPKGREVSGGGILSPVISTWGGRNGIPVRQLSGLKGSTQALAYSPDGRLLAAGRGMIRSDDTCVFIFQAGTDTILARLQPPPIMTHFAPKGVGAVRSIQFSPNSQFLAVGFRDGAIGIYESATGHLQRAISLSTPLQGPLAYSPNGKYLAFGQFRKRRFNFPVHNAQPRLASA